MASIGEDLRTFLLADAGISAAVGTRIHQDIAPQGYDGQYIWFGRGGTENEDMLDSVAGEKSFREFFDIETISRDINESLSLAALVKGKHNSRATFGSGTIQGLFVTDHADDYIPRGIGQDSGLFVAALQLEIVGYQ